MDKQQKQFVHNPLTGEMMDANTYSGKELLWKESLDNKKAGNNKSDPPKETE